MSEYAVPGVDVEELSSGVKPIEGVGTSTAGFVGAAERGPLAPRLISSWSEFRRWYGGYVYPQSYLAYAVEGFFANGGQRCFVSRIVNGDPAAGTKPACAWVQLGGGLNVVAVGPGSWGNHLALTVEPATQADRGWFKIGVAYIREGRVEASELFDDLTHEPGANNNAATILNATSYLVRAWWQDPVNALPLSPKMKTVDPAQPEPIPLTGGADGEPIVASSFSGGDEHPAIPAGQEALFGRGYGLKALESIDEIAILVVPDQARESLYDDVTNQVIDQCERLKDRFAVISARQGQADISALRPPGNTSYAAFYYPWIKVFDPSFTQPRLVPPSGHVAGIFARTDIERGVHKAPANEIVRGAVDLEFPVTSQMQDQLNPRGVNCIRDFRSEGRGIRLWGARTMSSDPEWKYVNVRRLFLFLEQSIDEGTDWVIFEPNNETTWANIRRVVEDFLVNAWRNGALMGQTPEKAFFVRCDRSTMTQNDLDNGRLVCLVGVAPIRPAEFVIFRIRKPTADFTT